MAVSAVVASQAKQSIFCRFDRLTNLKMDRRVAAFAVPRDDERKIVEPSPNRLRQDQPRAGSSPVRGGGPHEVWWRGTIVITGPRDTLKLARKLRSEMSLPEVILWRELRKRPGGFKFRRQHPAGLCILDFYCAAAKLAIEVDGEAHGTVPAVTRDRKRSAWLRSQGVGTTRIPAKSVLSDIEAVIVRIVDICRKRAVQLGSNSPVPLHQPVAGPPPPLGEE